MTLLQPTGNPSVMSASSPGFRERMARADWDKILTDGGIYLLALGGFYVGYKTLYTLALLVGYPQDQAMVVAALADLAILTYSRKAVREVKEGRSAWGIRLIVAAFSLGTFALQLRAAWPDPVSVVFHVLPPAVWIIGHEMMLRGELRQAKKQRRNREIALGLRPAPLPRIRLSWWLLDPSHTFTIWRLTKLWQKPQDVVIREEATRLRAQGEKIPRAWQGALVGPAPTTLALTITPLVYKNELVPAPKTPETRDAIKARLTLINGGQVEGDLRAQFLAALPPAPEKGSRTNEDMAAYITDVTQLAKKFNIQCTGKLLSELLDCDASNISRLRKDMEEGKYQPALAAAGA
jgi:hypothetical protein